MNRDHITETIKLKSKRLSDRDRTIILNFASKQIAATQDNSELDAAYERAADAIHAAILPDNPQKDMAVLAKYDCAEPDACIYISTTAITTISLHIARATSA